MNHYGKQQCLDKNWSNAKEITSEEIADCIHRHKLDVNKVPEARLRTVTEELIKLQNIDKKEQERKAIEGELAMYKYIDNGKFFATATREFEGYYIDPDLFETSLEAEEAMSELRSYYSYETIKTSEYDHEYKNTSTYSRNLIRLEKATEKIKKQYIDLGGLESEFNKHVSQIPIPKKGTLKEDIYQYREALQERFINMGVPLTRANKIAIAITQKVYFLLQ